MNRSRKTSFVLFCLIAATLGAGFVLYDRLPEMFVSHWDAQGRPDGTMSKLFAVIFTPAVMALLALMHAVIPRIDPLKANIERFRAGYDLLWLSIIGFLAYIHGLILAWNMGITFDFIRAFAPAFAGLWYAIGSVIGGAKRNWFIGIRTPWTLASDEIWDKTHRLAAKLFKVAAGFALLGLFLPSVAFLLIIIPAVVFAVVPIAHSYLLWRKRPA